MHTVNSVLRAAEFLNERPRIKGSDTDAMRITAAALFIASIPAQRPYHNFEHSMFVARIAQVYMPPNSTAEDYTAVALAGLFHDAKHFHENDVVNVATAQATFRNWARAYPLHKSLLQRVDAYIGCTVFSHGEFPFDPPDGFAGCLRDADLSMSFFENSKHLIPKLAQEMGRPYDIDFIMGNMHFLKRQRYFSDIAFCQVNSSNWWLTIELGLRKLLPETNEV